LAAKLGKPYFIAQAWDIVRPAAGDTSPRPLLKLNHDEIGIGESEADGEDEPVGSVAALQEVVAIAAVDDLAVQGGAHIVVSRAAIERIKAGCTVEEIIAQAAQDRVVANIANNTLTGSLGRDVITSNAGLDVFDFNSTAESGLTAATRDIITDFDAATNISSAGRSDVPAMPLSSAVLSRRATFRPFNRAPTCCCASTPTPMRRPR
jgi:hypothetical protein